jgi:ribonuclease HII
MWSHDYFEKVLRNNGFRHIAGVDEVGRGALAGPVVAAAVILDGAGEYSEIRDSKTLSPSRRERLSARISREAQGMAFGVSSEKVIDRINILRATQRAMRQAIRNLPIRPDLVLVDGFWLPGLRFPCIGVIDGDARSYSIAAASIVAKVRRDGMMQSFASRFPYYRFEHNKGYGTACHLKALASHGHCCIHRLTFEGVRGTPNMGGHCGQ